MSRQGLLMMCAFFPPLSATSKPFLCARGVLVFPTNLWIHNCIIALMPSLKAWQILKISFLSEAGATIVRKKCLHHEQNPSLGFLLHLKQFLHQVLLNSFRFLHANKSSFCLCLAIFSISWSRPRAKNGTKTLSVNFRRKGECGLEICSTHYGTGRKKDASAQAGKVRIVTPKFVQTLVAPNERTTYLWDYCLRSCSVTAFHLLYE